MTTNAAKTPPKAHPVLGWGLLALCVGLAALLFFRNPAEQPVTFCVVRFVTGFYCPGCGATRALYELLHLHPLRALSMNVYLAPLLPVLAYMALAEILRAIAGDYLLPPLRPPAWLLALLGAGLLLFGIARNLPGCEFLLPGGLFS